MIDTLALSVVLLTGSYLVGLGVVSFVAPTQAARFLLGFAGSAFAHYTELLIRVAVGGAFLLRAPHMLFSSAFVVFGWVLLITTACLFVVPWQWHHRFAQRSVPPAVRHLRLLGTASVLFGAFVLATHMVA